MVGMGKVYVANAFSLNMLKPISKFSEYVLLVKEVSENYVKKLLSENEFISVIGHESTAKFLSKRLGIEIKANRVEIKLEPGDLLIVAQLCKRLPEGEILSEKQLEQIHIKYFIVFVR